MVPVVGFVDVSVYGHPISGEMLAIVPPESDHWMLVTPPMPGPWAKMMGIVNWQQALSKRISPIVSHGGGAMQVSINNESNGPTRKI
jgi:hypothetical protein